MTASLRISLNFYNTIYSVYHYNNFVIILCNHLGSAPASCTRIHLVRVEWSQGIKHHQYQGDGEICTWGTIPVSRIAGMRFFGPKITIFRYSWFIFSPLWSIFKPLWLKPISLPSLAKIYITHILAGSEPIWNCLQAPEVILGPGTPWPLALGDKKVVTGILISPTPPQPP